MFASRETVLKKVVTIIATVILDLREGNAIKVSHYQEKKNFGCTIKWKHRSVVSMVCH